MTKLSRKESFALKSAKAILNMSEFGQFLMDVTQEQALATISNLESRKQD